jgi:hypothetical protein
MSVRLRRIVKNNTEEADITCGIRLEPDPARLLGITLSDNILSARLAPDDLIAQRWRGSVRLETRRDDTAHKSDERYYDS